MKKLEFRIKNLKKGRSDPEYIRLDEFPISYMQLYGIYSRFEDDDDRTYLVIKNAKRQTESFLIMI